MLNRVRDGIELIHLMLIRFTSGKECKLGGPVNLLCFKNISQANLILWWSISFAQNAKKKKKEKKKPAFQVLKRWQTNGNLWKLRWSGLIEWSFHKFSDNAIIYLSSKKVIGSWSCCLVWRLQSLSWSSRNIVL